MTTASQTNEKMLAMNEALVLGSVRQHELTEAAESLNARLQEEIAERKQVEAALRESEDRYRGLFNSIDEGFCVIEKVEGRAGAPPDFLYLEANPAFAVQSGMSGMVGKTIRQMLPDEPEGWCSIYDTVLRTGEPISFERGLVTHGRVLELYAFQVEDETHRRVAVIFKDITERKRAETALQESEEHFHTLFASAPMAVFVCDRNAVIQHYNRRAVELWGREPACGIEQHCGSMKLWLPNGTLLLHAQSPMVEVLRTGIPALNVEVFIERPDGSRLPVLVNFAALKNAQNEISGAITSFVDITERKVTEQTLRESEERFRALFELGPVAVYFCDAAGVIQNYNRRAVELWDREPASGDTDERFCGSFKLFRPDGSFMPHDQCPMAEVVSGKIPVARDAEVLIERPDGSRVTVVVNIRPLKNPRGEITGAINCFYDITERKEAEARQRLLMNELAHRGKNLLAVVNSIASRTMSGERSLAEAREVLANRIQALARSQTVLMADGFEYASLAEIIRLEFEAFSDRVNADGPDVMLNPKTAQTFALLIHELATNATKYGGLSQSVGRVSVQWKVEGTGEEAEFRFRWQEHDGPPVKPPTREGFGRLLLERVVAQDFSAKPKVRFASEGLIYEIHAPLSVVAAEISGGGQFLIASRKIL